MKIKKTEDTPLVRNITAFEIPEKLMPFVTTKVNSGNGKTYMKVTSEPHARALAQRVAPINSTGKPTDYSWEVVEA